MIKSSLKLYQNFHPNVMGEGWGLTYDGKNLIAQTELKSIFLRCK